MNYVATIWQRNITRHYSNMFDDELMGIIRHFSKLN